MTVHAYCTVINADEVEVKGSALTFRFAGDEHTFYLSPEAMRVLLEKLPGSLYDEMASENIRLERQLKDVHDVLYGGKK